MIRKGMIRGDATTHMTEAHNGVDKLAIGGTDRRAATLSTRMAARGRVRCAMSDRLSLNRQMGRTGMAYGVGCNAAPERRPPVRCQEMNVRAILLVTFAVAVVTSGSAAEERATTLPEIIVGAPATAEHQRCVDVTIGNDQSFGCLNERLKRQVDSVNPTLNVAPIDAKSSDLKVGVVNMPGVQQQYGKNFGVSVRPYRPAAPVYAPPVGHR